MHRKDAHGLDSLRPTGEVVASPGRLGFAAAAPGHRRLGQDAGALVLMLAAVVAAVAVDVNLYSALESRIHLCLPR
jgi:hypothetical protein